ncbi:S8 family serine peptidase [Candidatus Contendibacter odensensis]|uniref:Peptidase families S8 and S53 domain protein n=1 Tax=Candidatus Contendobacter odensis Run_B_J11 TaxID=1400861 RepID=A0A7U7GAE4_9GAMM|nr:S8 family serine peptidase [Candidatus Contendobacter odensis]CDH44824.1 putative Peptidase families S8 and S53 domain protein [Candidatus Contendobacter odensis Run_B_J11]
MKRVTSKRSILMMAIATLLSQACGGGGGSDNSTPPTPPTPPPTTQYTLSGTIRPASGTAIDSDVNDPVASYRSNDTVAEAQPIPNPVTLSGYVNQPGSGSSGRSRTTGDEVDVYKVSLLAGQPINLLIAGDGVNDDLDLALADINGKIIDASASQNRAESLTIKTGGDYLVVVAVDKGASNYVLTIGQALAPVSTGTRLRLSDPFVTGEAIVLFRDAATMPAGGLRAQALNPTVREQGEPERNTLIELDKQAQVSTYSPLADTAGSCFPEEFQPDDPVLRDKLKTLCLIKVLKRDSSVADATPNFIREVNFVPNDPLYQFQWHYPQINLPQTWDLTTGANTLVAVIDTGVVLSHPDLQGQLVDGYDFIKDPANAGDGDGIDRDPSDPGDRSNPDGSSSFHGTHVSGTVAAATNNSIGVAGVAFSAKVMPLRVCGQFGCSDYDIEQAMRFAARLPNDSGTVPPRRADVINLSIGGPGFSSASQAVYDQVRAAGVVIVAAAGNEASSEPSYPAGYPGVIGVSAVDINKNLAPYSNFGPWVSVAAPGGSTARDVNGDGKPDGVLSTVATDSGGKLVNDYVIWQGTSMATPHMAGVVALMKSVAPNLTPADVANLLASGALTEDLGTAGKDDRFGYGLINAYKAVTAAANTGGNPVNPTPILAVSPSALNFGISVSSQTLTVLNGGGSNLTVNAPTENSGGWLSVTPTQINASGIGNYAVAVRRDGLADGVYSATITFGSNANGVQVRVIMQIANNLSAGAVGQQYVLLVNPTTGDTIADVTAVRQANGSYTYTLSDVPAGSYEIFAGSDSNNNQFICDIGESCGAYITTDAPVMIEVNQNRSGLDFVSGFTVNLADFKSVKADTGETGKRRHSTRQVGTAH